MPVDPVRSERGRHAAQQRWKNHVPKKNDDGRILNLPKGDEPVYTSENLLDAKKGEAFDFLEEVLRHWREQQDEVKRMRGRRDPNAGVAEFMAAGQVQACEHFIDWLRIRYSIR